MQVRSGGVHQADNALYEQHLVFDNIIEPTAATARERFKAFARPVRDILARRWVLTEATYERERPKRVYYPRWARRGGHLLSDLRLLHAGARPGRAQCH